mmetsp:Transcript_21578/g.48590  ORF Transcript_21578/g.48590 Transcript_21578/m.48590 type:complete len:201 (+) Transcript_21578:1068-1670(+)
MLESLCDRLPSILDQLGRVSRIDPLRHHLVETQHRTRLQHSAQDRLLAHQVALHLRDERALQHTRTVAACRHRVCLCDIQPVTVGVVLRMDSDECGHSEAALILFTHLGARALWRHHDDREVGPDLHPLLDDVEAVAVRERRPLLHHRHHRRYHCCVLLVRREVEHEISLRNELLVRSHRETIGGRVDVALSLALNGALT